MYTLKEYQNPKINKAVTYLYAQVFLLTQRRQIALQSGDCGLAEIFHQAETMTRLAVEELYQFDNANEALSPIDGLDWDKRDVHDVGVFR